jgi:hypothetical protein
VPGAGPEQEVSIQGEPDCWGRAFTKRGPTLLELSFIGDIEVFQIFGPPGIFTEQFRTFYATQKVW